MKCEACQHDNMSDARYCAACGALLPTEVPGDDPMIGKVIGGRFRVTGVLGEGGMGVVYVGEQPMGSTTRKVAIKTLHSHLSKDPSVLQRFHRECGTVAQLEHPNTIKVYDFGSTDDGILYIAMEFVDGKALNALIEEGGALPPDRAVKIMRQVCGALDEAHAKGIIHRDLKPENVILTDRAGETDFVKVLDFGIAARTESADAQKEQKLTQQGMVLGTPPYMSPEQFTGKALDARSDIYSLGVMCYEMLTARLPFDADTPWQWATQHMTAQPIPFEVAAPARNIPDGMRTAILRAMAKEREERQETARQFFAQLSEGERMTIERPASSPKASAGSTGTAAMEAAPDFMAGAPMTGLPMGAQAQPMPPMGMAPAVVAPVPAPPPPVARKGGGKGLVIGLATVGAVLLVAIVVVAARSMKPEQDDQPLANPFTGPSSGVASIAPIETPPPAETAPVASSPPAKDVPVVQAPSRSTGSRPSSGSTTSSTHSGSTTNTGTTGGTGKPAAGGNGCDSCISSARSGNVLGAASAYRSCSDAGKKAQCRALVQRSAASAARAAAFNGKCPQAKAIVAAAKGMGASAPSLDAAIATCH